MEHLNSGNNFNPGQVATVTALGKIFFSKVNNQIFSVVGQYISEPMAEAMSEVFRRVHSMNTEDTAKKLNYNHQNTHTVEEEKVPYIAIKEINLDDNGLKDVAFSHILKALAT